MNKHSATDERKLPLMVRNPDQNRTSDEQLSASTRTFITGNHLQIKQEL